MIRSYIQYIIIVIGFILGCLLIANAYRYKFQSTETISVTGLAETDFISDQIVWKGVFTRYGVDLKQSYQALKSDEAEIRKYLQTRGVPDSNFVFSSVNVEKNYETNYDDNGRIRGTIFRGYILTGIVTVDSKNINLVEQVSREVTELLQKGIEFNSNRPNYYYSKLNELKIDLLAKASQDARQRAESIAKNSGVGIGKLKKATMGVFQITGKNNNEEYSYGGSFNTSSKQKTASITLRVEYLAN
ncbi:MAG: SIMPL domain-containing protein [Chitinophagaceae bacterium]|nr:SIMPL domain-containing protein [Chitinophagaceae bacterium]